MTRFERLNSQRPLSMNCFAADYARIGVNARSHVNAEDRHPIGNLGRQHLAREARAKHRINDQVG